MNEKVTLVQARLGTLFLDFLMVGGGAETHHSNIEKFLQDAPAGTIIERVLQKDAFDEDYLFLGGDLGNMVRHPPCNGCTACCTAWGIDVMPWEEGNGDDEEDVIPEWGDGDPMTAVAHIASVAELQGLDGPDDPFKPGQEWKTCSRCGVHGCTKYTRRPAACRTFNCAVAVVTNGVPNRDPAVTARGHELLRAAAEGADTAVRTRPWTVEEV